MQPERDTEADPLGLGAPANHDLAAQPQRPGELAAMVLVALSEPARRHIGRGASSAALPVNLWLVIAIEAQRSLIRATEVVDMSAEHLADRLDAAAAHSWDSRDEEHLALGRLRAYAEAVRDRRGPSAGPLIPASVPLSPSLTVAAAWALQAQRCGVSIEQWASQAAGLSLPCRATWEAASAAAAQPLSEWVLAQAARR